jgi:hypothetical protein
MNIEIKTEEYRGVICRLCTQPIPVPRIVISMEEDSKREEAVTGLFQGDRVFTLRCRSCEGEYPYRSKDIVTLEGSPKPRRSSREADLLRPSRKLSRAANA